MEQVTKQMEELQLHSIKDISEEFNKLQLICLNYEETCGDQSENTYESTITRLQNVQTAIISHSLFSPNEDFDEIQTEYIKYFQLPYFMGDLFGRFTENRKKNLEFCKLYLTEFLKLVDHYGIIPENIRKQWKNQVENPRYDMDRDEKIAQFKFQKELETKIKNIDMIKDEDQQRDVIKTQIQVYVIKAINYLKSLDMEFEILAYKQKIQDDKEAKEIHEGLLKKPLPKLKYWNIPKQDEQSKLPYMINQQEQQHHVMCQPCQGKTAEEIKQIKRNEVWQSDISQPTVRLSELADMYMADMAKMEEQKQQAEEEAKIKAENVDSDCEDEVEQKRLEQTYWDNWKDDNEKGAGNRMGK